MDKNFKPMSSWQIRRIYFVLMQEPLIFEIITPEGSSYLSTDFPKKKLPDIDISRDEIEPLNGIFCEIPSDIQKIILHHHPASQAFKQYLLNSFTSIFPLNLRFINASATELKSVL